MGKPFVVGYDGTPTSQAAVRWAADRAEAEHRMLRVVHIPPWPSPWPATAPTVLRSVDAIRTAAERLLDPLDAELRDKHPALPTDLAVVVGNVLPVLLREAQSAHLLVLGKGPIAIQLTGHVRCPVIVVPGLAHGSADVVVGADGMPYSEAALDFAFRYAENAATGLVAIQTPASPAATQRSSINHPEVNVVTRTVESPADALVAASAFAGLLVIGSRGGAAVHGELSHSVTQAVLQRSRCPVAVVQGGPQ